MWTDEINFYHDGTSFQLKFNPKDQTIAPLGREWRKPSAELKKDCTSKGAKVENGGRVAHFIVAISYKIGTVVCQQYDASMEHFLQNLLKTNSQKCLVNAATLIASYFSKMEIQAKTVKQLGKSWNHMELSRLAFQPEVQTSIT